MASAANPFGFLGDELFGQDVDKMFAYQTPKIVKIHDRTLGLLRLVLTLLIFIYIFIFNIWYKGSHFALSDVEGLARLQWQEPVQKCNPYDVECDANYKSSTDLPYCDQYSGKQPANFTLPCDYYDARELPINMPNGVLLPTCFFRYHQVRSCEKRSPACSKKWGYADDKDKLQSGTGYAETENKDFVADVEDFTLLIDHTFRTANGQMSVDDYEMQGAFMECEKGNCQKKLIQCVHKNCTAMGMQTEKASASLLDFAHGRWNSDWTRKHSNNQRKLMVGMDADDTVLNLAEDEAHQSAHVFAIKEGDVMSLKTVLALAGKSLDDTWVDRETGNFFSVRKRGLVISVEIKYENLVRWTLFRPGAPWYTIRVKAMPAATFKYADVKESADGESREMRLAYGTMVIVTQSGNLAFFCPITALMTMMTAMALLAASTTLTELLMLNVLPHKDEYTDLKFKESRDFNDHEERKEAAGAAP